MVEKWRVLTETASWIGCVEAKRFGGDDADSKTSKD
jgi:hypothetical protein